MAKNKKQPPDLDELRRIALAGVLSTDVLAERLVLKGGNALRLGHGVSGRASMDLDFSMSDDFNIDSLEDIERVLFEGLRNRFDTHGLVVIDPKFTPKPDQPVEDPTWGGYQVKFKLIARERYEELKGDPNKMSRVALAANGPAGGPSMSIDISKHEFISDTETEVIEFGGLPCRIYSLRLIVAEKLRAIVQQMKDAPPEKKRTRRPRDFFDIYMVCFGKEEKVLGDNFGSLVEKVFAAKKTPLHLVALISHERDWHELDWPSVRDSAPDAGEDFGPTFEYVVDLARRYIPSGT